MKEKEELVDYKGNDITEPICNLEQMKRLASKGKFPTVFINNSTIGWGFIKLTERMKKATLKQRASSTYGKQYDCMFPERVVRDIIIDYCNNFPFPKMLFDRIRKDLEKNIKFKKDEAKK